MTDLAVLSRTQIIVVDPATSAVAIINAGPPGAGSGGGGDVSSTSPTVQPGGDFWDWVSNDPDMTFASEDFVVTEFAARSYIDAAVGSVTGSITPTSATVQPAGDFWDWVHNDPTFASNSQDHLITEFAAKGYIDGKTTFQSADDEYFLVTQSGSVTTIAPGTALGTGGSSSFLDNAFTLQNVTTPTKQAMFSAASIAAGVTRTYTLQDASGTLAMLGPNQSWTGLNEFDYLTYTRPAGATVGWGMGQQNNITERNQPFEFSGNISYGPIIGFLHDGGTGAIGGTYGQSAANAVLMQLGARGHTGSPNSSLGYSAGNAGRLVLRAQASPTATERGCQWEFYNTRVGDTVMTQRHNFEIRDTGVFGYASSSSGVGGAVAQATSRTTAVTLDKACGDITVFGTVATTVNTNYTFTLNNALIEAGDIVDVCIVSGNTSNAYMASVTKVAAGSCEITYRVFTAGLTENIVLRFTVRSSMAA